MRTFTATTTTRDQPVAMGGTFVMNTQAEIAQAYRDFRSRKLGDIPRAPRLQYR